MHDLTVTDIRSIFINELANERFTIDKTGAKTIEMIGASFIATEPSIFGTVNEEYVRKEIDWYLGLSTNINDIYGDVLESGKEPPKAWQYTANDHGEINSNYGYLIYADKYFRQYESALIELENNPDSRRATMIYQRPSIQVEFQENGKNDFICTNAVTYYIRDEKLSCVVQMRSNDVVYGYKNDYAWQQFVLNTLAQDLNVDTGDIMWQVQNLHVYEKHFDLVK
jgi:thymidylate synthase